MNTRLLPALPLAAALLGLGWGAAAAPLTLAAAPATQAAAQIGARYGATRELTANGERRIRLAVADADDAGSRVQTVNALANALGVYSNEAGEGTSGQTWLRGYQLTDAAGLVTFKTIIPGWYPGRTTHIHLRVRSKYSEASSTGDGTDTTTNAGDRVYTQQTKGETLLTLTGDAAGGYSATFALNLPIT